MPIEYSIDTERTRLEVRATGTIMGDELDAVRDQLAADPRFNPAMTQLLDFSAADLSALSTGAIRRLAAASITGTSQRAWIVADNLAFGLIRMYESMGVDRSGQLQIFRDRAAALAWLDLSSSPPKRPEAGPV